MSINLSDLSLKELKELHGQVSKAIATYEDRKKWEALVELEDTAKRLGFSLQELTGATPAAARKRTSAPPKYANPGNPDNTWTGRGRKPKWMEAALRAGKSLDELLIEQ